MSLNKIVSTCSFTQCRQKSAFANSRPKIIAHIRVIHQRIACQLPKTKKMWTAVNLLVGRSSNTSTQQNSTWCKKWVGIWHLVQLSAW